MNLRTKMSDALSEVRHLEGAYVNSVRSNSKDMNDYMELNYFSGLRNGLAFMIHVLNNPIEEEEFDKMLKEILHQGEVN